MFEVQYDQTGKLQYHQSWDCKITAVNIVIQVRTEKGHFRLWSSKHRANTLAEIGKKLNKSNPSVKGLILYLFI